MTDLRDANEFLVDMGINTYQDGIDRVNAYTFQNASNIGRLAFRINQQMGLKIMSYLMNY